MCVSACKVVSTVAEKKSRWAALKAKTQQLESDSAIGNLANLRNEISAKDQQKLKEQFPEAKSGILTKISEKKLKPKKSVQFNLPSADLKSRWDLRSKYARRSTM